MSRIVASSLSLSLLGLLLFIIALGSLIVSIYGVSLSWRTMASLHRPFIALAK